MSQNTNLATTLVKALTYCASVAMTPKQQKIMTLFTLFHNTSSL
jgi:hypothetical protein